MSVQGNERGPVEKRALVISYNYPPVGMVGSIRTTKLVKFLGLYGWSATVLTVLRDSTAVAGWDPGEGVFPGVNVIRARFCDLITGFNRLLMALGILGPPERMEEPGAAGSLEVGGWYGGALRAAFAWLKRWVAFPDRYLLWFPSAFMAGLLELRRSHYNLIYSTSPPVTCHLVAAALNRLTGVPWVADLRDPWVLDQVGATPCWRFLQRKLEKAVLRKACAVVTVSEPLACDLREFHGEKPWGYACITNGFDPDDFASSAQPGSDRFTIVHTGVLADLHRDATEVISVLEELVREGKVPGGGIRLELYGPPDRRLTEIKERLAFPELLEIKGVVPRRQALSKQQGATALLVVLADHPYWATVYGAKVLEYLGAERPILAWSPRGGVIAELLERTRAGVAVGDRDSLRRVLEEWIEEFRSSGGLPFKGEEREISRYRWDLLAGRFAGLFDTVTGSG